MKQRQERLLKMKRASASCKQLKEIKMHVIGVSKGKYRGT